MKTKLTLRLDVALIEQAKAHAKSTGRSISALVADFFAGLQKADRPENEDKDSLPPNTAALVGLLHGADVGEDDYHAYLEEKHR